MDTWKGILSLEPRPERVSATSYQVTDVASHADGGPECHVPELRFSAAEVGFFIG
jgi:hypothetical protein